MIFMMYDKDFMNLYCTSCTLFKNLCFIYITMKICREKSYWRIWIIKKRRLWYIKMYLLIQILFFKEEEIQSSHENKLKKVF